MERAPMGSCSDHEISSPYLWAEVDENAGSPDGAFAIDHHVPDAENCGVVGAPANETVVTLTVHDNVVVEGCYRRMVTVNLNRAQATELAEILNRRLAEPDSFGE